MSSPRSRTWFALALIALIQTGVLLHLVLDRMRLIAAGREITLPIRPVDPRDIFRGEYVRLGYDIDTLPLRLLTGERPADNAAFFVVLERGEGGDWQPVQISSRLPSPLPAERIALKARPLSRWPVVRSPEATQGAHYGIEQYFVPQGEGRRLESLAREKKLAARIAVDSGGNAALKGLVIDGKLEYEEPLF